VTSSAPSTQVAAAPTFSVHLPDDPEVRAKLGEVRARIEKRSS
jgi:hypothetical protein